jgi:hypothetical protein
VRDFVFEQSGVSLVHVAYYNRNVLKPPVKTPRVLWDRPTLLAEVLRQRDAFLTELERRNAQPRAAQTQQCVLFLATRVGNGNQFKRERVRKKPQFATKVIHRQSNRTYFANACQDRQRKCQKHCDERDA